MVVILFTVCNFEVIMSTVLYNFSFIVLLEEVFLMEKSISYLIFDVEAVADGDLIQRVLYPHEELTAKEAVRRYRDDLIAKRGDGKDFIPHTFMQPISVAVGKVDSSFQLIDLITLDAPDFRPHKITQLFWEGWRYYRKPTFVTFNGRGYDLPLLEIAAYRYGISLPEWFNVEAKSFEQARNRFNVDRHVDLMDLFSNFGAARMTGGLNLLANLIGKPGKTGIDGSKVQDIYDAGGVQEINDYCVCDVLDTYFVFLRSRVLLGQLSLENEQTRVDDAKRLLESRAESVLGFAHYLEHWGDWELPSSAEAVD